jgi:hypothetical protein
VGGRGLPPRETELGLQADGGADPAQRQRAVAVPARAGVRKGQGKGERLLARWWQCHRCPVRPGLRPTRGIGPGWWPRRWGPGPAGGADEPACLAQGDELSAAARRAHHARGRLRARARGAGSAGGSPRSRASAVPRPLDTHHGLPHPPGGAGKAFRGWGGCQGFLEPEGTHRVQRGDSREARNPEMGLAGTTSRGRLVPISTLKGRVPNAPEEFWDSSWKDRISATREANLTSRSWADPSPTGRRGGFCGLRTLAKAGEGWERGLDPRWHKGPQRGALSLVTRPESS